MYPRRELEDLAAVHLHERVRVLEVPRAGARIPQVLAPAAVRAELEADEPAPLDRLHDDRTGAVPEEDERRAVLPVEDLREHVSTDHERASREPRREHPVRLGDRVDEAGAAGEKVVGGRLRHPERVREERGGGREHHVRRHRRADEEIDVRCVDAGILESRARSGKRDVRQRLVLGGDPPLAECRSARGSTRPRCPRSRRAPRSSSPSRGHVRRGP